MVVCPYTLASEAGLSILRQGGNAIDAAIAANAALSVVYPHMTGIGGDSFWLIYHAQSHQIYGLNGSGRSAQAASRDFYHRRNLTTIPQRGPLAAITVPGAVDAWAEAHEKFGRLSWAEILQPAIDLAEQGYPVSASQVRWTQRDRDLLHQYPSCQQVFLPHGQTPKVGAPIRNPDLAQILRLIATDGRTVFYKGEIAKNICTYLAEIGGILTPADFAAHRSDWVEPITTQYRGYTVCELPPNTQGLAVLQILNLIEPFDLQQMGHNTSDYYHLIVEATKLAFADRDRWITDPAFVNIPMAELISKAYSDRRRAGLSLTQAQPYRPVSIGGDTTYSACVDSEGNAVSLIQSLYFDYGSGIAPREMGFMLQNRGCFFSLDANHINCLEPGKRTFHTLIPGLVLNGQGFPYLVFGAMGGEGQPQTQLALLTRVLDFGFDPQTAIDWPRWLWGQTWGESISGLSLEGRIGKEIRTELRQRGHIVHIAPDWSEQMGHAHIIRIDPETHLLAGGCDPRSDGSALGF